MSRYSCTWEYGFGKEQCPEEIWSGSEEYCIFHDPSPEKDSELFGEKLKEKLERKDYNFKGYFFPEGIYFENFEFEEGVDFGGTTFHYAAFEGAIFQDANFIVATFQYADFTGATFQKNADFRKAIFQDANFIGATFQYADFTGAIFQDANFIGATFQYADFTGAIFQDANFGGTTFQYANFSGATLEKNMEFAPKHIEELDLRFSQFYFRGTVTADLKKTLFHGAYLENVAFIDCEWPERIYEEEHSKDEDIDLTFKELETIYRDLKQNMQRHGDYSQAGSFYYREMECRKKVMREKKLSVNWFRSFGYSFLKYTCGYGEKPFNVIGSAALIIVTMAFLFQFGGIVLGEYTPEERIIDYDIHLTSPTWNSVKDYFQCLYYSFVTFTTLGYGDIHPIGYSKAFACAEAFTGAFFIALFVLVLGRKMMR